MTPPLLLLPLDPTAPPQRTTTPADADAPVRLVVPGCDVHLVWLPLPQGTPAQVLAAARLALAAHLATPTQDLHLAIAPALDNASPRLVAAVAPARLQDWLARAAAAGARVAEVVPDCLLLDPPSDGLRVLSWDGRWLLRGPQLACSVEPELARLISGQPALQAECDALDVLASGTPALDLLQPRSGHAADAPLWSSRRLRLLALAVLLSPALLLAAQAGRYTLASARLHAHAAALVSQATGQPPGDDPLQQLDQARQQQGQDRFIRLCTALADAIAANPGVRLERLDYQHQGALRATVHSDDPAVGDALRQQLQAAGVHATGVEPDATRNGLLVLDLQEDA